MIKSHECEYSECNQMVSLTRSKRGVPNYPKSQREIDSTQYCSQKCYGKSRIGKKFARAHKPIIRKVITPLTDLANQFGLRART